MRRMANAEVVMGWVTITSHL